MRILVFVKDVPDGPDPAPYTRSLTLDRLATESSISAVDPFAVAEAVRLVGLVDDRRKSSVTVATMGPDAAAASLREALALGADAALHVSDARLLGADASLTSRVLEQVAHVTQPDLVLLGRESSDSGLGVMAGMLAERLGWPAMSAVDRLTVSSNGRGSPAVVIARRRSEHGVATLMASLPLVASAAEYAAELRPIHVDDLRRAYLTPVRRLTLDDLGLVEEVAAWSAAPSSRVRSVREVQTDRRSKLVTTDPVAAVVRELQAAGIDLLAPAAHR